MDKARLLEKVNQIFINTLDNDSIVVTDSTTANDIYEWTSLNHIELIVAMEKAFKVKFTSAEIYQSKNVGELCNAILTKLS